MTGIIHELVLPHSLVGSEHDFILRTRLVYSRIHRRLGNLKWDEGCFSQWTQSSGIPNECLYLHQNLGQPMVPFAFFIAFKSGSLKWEESNVIGAPVKS